MAKNVVIRGVTYSEVPSVEIPLAEGEGTAKFHDTTGASMQPSDLRDGVTGFGANGPIVGTLKPAIISYDSETKILSIS